MWSITVCSLLAVAQPPADKSSLTVFGSSVVWSADKPADDLAVALADHPDVQIAEAKLKIAQAELTKVKQAVALRVAAARTYVEEVKARLDEAQAKLKAARERPIDKPDRQTENVALLTGMVESAKRSLAAAEAELQSASGRVMRSTRAAAGAQIPLDERYIMIADQTGQPKAALYPVADKLRELLDKPVKVGGLSKVSLQQALDALQTATGTDLMFRSALPNFDPAVPPPQNSIVLSVPAGERPLRAWLDLIGDEYRGRATGVAAFDVYVREYGLVWQLTSAAPPGAGKLSAVVRQPKVEPPKDVKR